MATEPTFFARKASGLTRELTWADVFMFCIAGPAASGIFFFSVSTVTEYPGGNIGIAFVMGIFIFLPIMLCLAITSAALPRSGGMYVIISRVLDPAIGFLGAWLLLVGFGLVIGVVCFTVTALIGGGFELVGMSAIGGWLSSTVGSSIGAVLWIFLFWALNRLGIRTIRRSMHILFAIPLFATAICILYFVTTSPAEAGVAFNRAWGSGAFEAVIAAARDLGWQPAAFSWPETFRLLQVVLFAYVGIESITYAAGEIKEPRKIMVSALLWGTIAVGLLYVVVSSTVFLPYGDFIGAYDYLYDNARETLAIIMRPVQPSIAFYAASLIPYAALAIPVIIGVALWFANSALPLFLANARVMFALAIDRALPEGIADVDEGRETPTWATDLTSIFALLGVAVVALHVETLLAILTITSLFIFWAFGLAAMLLPYRQPEIYAQAAVKYEVAGVPVVTILGFVVFLEGLFFVFFSGLELTIITIVTLLGTIALGFLIYLRQTIKAKRGNLDIRPIFNTIPPD